MASRDTIDWDTGEIRIRTHLPPDVEPFDEIEARRNERNVVRWICAAIVLGGCAIAWLVGSTFMERL